MSVSDKDRLDLRQAFERVFGDEHLAEVVMNSIPPIPFHEFATKSDLHAGFGELRGELKADIGELKAEMGELRGEMGELRGEMGELKGEVRAGISGLRAEMGEFRGELRAEMSELRGELRGEMGVLRGDLQTAMAGQFRILVGAQVATLVAVVSLIPILS